MRVSLGLVYCQECVFWAPDGGAFETGACQRHAPRPRLADEYDDNLEAAVVWPLTRRDDGCGDGLRRAGDGAET